jgi:hypothetical protein
VLDVLLPGMDYVRRIKFFVVLALGADGLEGRVDGIYQFKSGNVK